MFEFEIHMIGCLQKTQGDPPKIQIDTFGVFFYTQWKHSSYKMAE